MGYKLVVTFDVYDDKNQRVDFKSVNTLVTPISREVKGRDLHAMAQRVSFWVWHLQRNKVLGSLFPESLYSAPTEHNDKICEKFPIQPFAYSTGIAHTSIPDPDFLFLGFEPDNSQK